MTKICRLKIAHDLLHFLWDGVFAALPALGFAAMLSRFTNSDVNARKPGSRNKFVFYTLNLSLGPRTLFDLGIND